MVDSLCSSGCPYNHSQMGKGAVQKGLIAFSKEDVKLDGKGLLRVVRGEFVRHIINTLHTYMKFS